MKKILYLFTLLLLASCDSENAPDCFKNAGSTITETFSVDTFTKITVFKNVELIITQDQIQSVTVETGSNLLSKVSAVVENGRLLLKDENGCNYTRDYGITKVYVNAPNLTEIRNSSQLTVSSNGILNYPNLTLTSEDNLEDYYNVGLFNLAINTTNLNIIVNNFTTATITGTVDNLSLGYFSGDGRFEGRNLIANNVTIYHRGTNDITINPQVALTANLVSTGDVIAVNTPPFLDIQEQFDGRVIFE